MKKVALLLLFILTFGFGQTLIINEIMQNPSAVSDANGEWFEIYNNSDEEIDLNGFTIKDNDTDSHLITEETIIAPYSFAVLGRNADSTTNGGLSVDYEYSGFTLANGADEVVLIDSYGITVDSVAYDGGPNWPDPNGASMALLEISLDNTIGSNWVEYDSLTYGDGDYGTPGELNFPIIIEGSVINVPGDQPTIQDAINVAVSGDTVLVQPGTYYENINYNGKNIVIGSLILTTGDTSYISQTVIDGNEEGSVVTINSGEDSTTVLRGFTIKNGLATYGGGILVGNSTVKLKQMIIDDNIATDQGGGVFIVQSNNVLIEDCQFSNNTSVSSGAAIQYHQGSTGKIVDTIVENNVSGYSGVIYVFDSEVHLENCLVVNNTSNNEGIFFSYGGKSRISNSTFYNNTISNTGGAIGLGYSDTVFVINSIVYNNNPASFYMAANEQWEPIVIDYTDAEGGESAVINGNISEVIWGDGNIDANPLFCNPDSGGYTLAENSPCVGTGQDGVNMGALDVGCEPILLIEIDPIPEKFTLYQNYPNPFNPITTLRYDLPKQSHVNIVIYNMLGRQVRTLINQTQEAGFKSMTWDANDDRGKPASAGIYLYTIQAGDFRQTLKMVLLK
jgi:hypothetical protein